MSGPTLNRFFMKQVTLFMVYDRVTGRLIGETADTKPVAAILTPQGFYYDDRVSPVECKLGLGVEEVVHKAVVKARHGNTTIWLPDGTQQKVAIKTE